MSHGISFGKVIGWHVLCGVIACSWPLSADTVSYSAVNGQQQYKITTTGVYQVVAYGAQGGTNNCCGGTPGQGAEIGGDFTLTAGTILDLYIGQQGIAGAMSGGGGGGTFVTLDASGMPGELLMAAGGGGGSFAHLTGLNASLTTAGTAGMQGGSGGTNGNGGGGNSAGAGGGYLSNGGSGINGSGGDGFSLAGGAGFNGGTGGYGGGGGDGGFGGGGGGGYSGAEEEEALNISAVAVAVAADLMWIRRDSVDPIHWQH